MGVLKLGIIDYKVGNLGSVYNAFFHIAQHAKHFGLTHKLEYVLESKPENLYKYDKLLLPGVGAFANAMKHLKDSHLDEAIREFVQSGKTLLGICLGMQLLFEKSLEFGEYKGLGLLKGEVVGFDFSMAHNGKTKGDRESHELDSYKYTASNLAGLKIPHTGWNSCHFTKQGREHALLRGICDGSFFYFVHSFHIGASLPCVLAHCSYGYPFGAIVGHNNLYAIQAHPEKSHEVGLKLLSNFLNC